MALTRIKITLGENPTCNVSIWEGSTRRAAFGTKTIADAAAIVSDNLHTDEAETLLVLEAFLVDRADGVDLVAGRTAVGDCFVPFDTNFKRGLNCGPGIERTIPALQVTA